MTAEASTQSDRGITAVARLFLSQQRQTSLSTRHPPRSDNTTAIPDRSPAGKDACDNRQAPDRQASAVKEDFQYQHNKPLPMVLTSCRPADVVEAYKTIKSLSLCRESDTVLLLVCDAPDAAEAQMVFRKLAAASRRFLDLELCSAGYHLKDAKIASPNLISLLQDNAARLPYLLPAPH